MAVIQCNHERCSNGRSAQEMHWKCEGREVSYEGAVLDVYERNGYDDSDFYAIVWDEENQRITTVAYATTRAWTYHNSATVDATEETLAKAAAYLLPELLARMEETLRFELNHIGKGDRIRSTATRGKNKGVEGVVVWEGNNQYASRYESKNRRYGVQTDNGERRYLNENQAERVETIEPTEDQLAELRKRAEYKVTHDGSVWRSYMRAAERF